MRIRNRFPVGAATYQYLWSHSLFDTLKYMASLGLEIAEIMTCEPHARPAALSPSDRLELRRNLASLGLKLVAINPSYGDLNLASALPEARQLAVAHVKENLQLASDLDCKILIIVPGKRHFMGTPPFEHAWDWIFESLIECVNSAETLGVTLAIEHVNLNFIDTSESLCKLVAALNSPYAGILFDTGNANIVSDPLDFLDAISSQLVHVHFDDNDGKNWLHAPIGHGNINFSAIVDRLERIDYQGSVVCEFWYPQDPERSLEESLGYLQKI